MDVGSLSSHQRKMNWRCRRLVSQSSPGCREKHASHPQEQALGKSLTAQLSIQTFTTARWPSPGKGILEQKNKSCKMRKERGKYKEEKMEQLQE